MPHRNTRVSTVRPATLGFQARLAAAFSIKLAFIRRQRKQHVVLRQCVAGCRSGVLRQDRLGMYDMPDGAFDIHYVDAEGKEIAPDKALAAQIKVKPAAGST